MRGLGSIIKFFGMFIWYTLVDRYRLKFLNNIGDFFYEYGCGIYYEKNFKPPLLLLKYSRRKKWLDN